MPDKRRLQRTRAVLRNKKAVLEREHQEFSRLSNTFKDLTRRLEKSQAEYLEGVKKINSCRKSAYRTNLEIMEAGVDATKKDWVDIYKKRQQVSAHLEKQRNLVLKMQKQVSDFGEHCEALERDLEEEYLRKEDLEITGLSRNYRFTTQKKQEP